MTLEDLGALDRLHKRLHEMMQVLTGLGFEDKGRFVQSLLALGRVLDAERELAINPKRTNT